MGSPNQVPVHVKDPVIGMARVDTANANLDGTGTIAALVSGSTYGTRITLIEIRAAETTTAGMIRFFLNDGVDTRLWREEPVSAVTPSGTVEAFSAQIDLSSAPLILPTGWGLGVSTENSEDFNVFAHGGSF